MRVYKIYAGSYYLRSAGTYSFNSDQEALDFASNLALGFCAKDTKLPSKDYIRRHPLKFHLSLFPKEPEINATIQNIYKMAARAAIRRVDTNDRTS